MWHRPVGSTAIGCSSLDVVIDHWMIPFVAYTASETPYARQLAGKPLKCPLPVEESRPHIIHGSFGPTRVIRPNDISIDSAVFAAFTREPNTQTHRYTDHATCDIDSNRLQHNDNQEAPYRRGTAWRVVSWNLVNCCTAVRKIHLWKYLQRVNDVDGHSRSS